MRFADICLIREGGRDMLFYDAVRNSPRKSLFDSAERFFCPRVRDV